MGTSISSMLRYSEIEIFSNQYEGYVSINGNSHRVRSTGKSTRIYGIDGCTVEWESAGMINPDALLILLGIHFK